MTIQHGSDASQVLDENGNVIFDGPHKKAIEVYIKLSVMTRKHYRAVAKGLAGTRPAYNAPNRLHQWETVVETLCETFQTMNPYFNRNKFLEVCGFEGFYAGDMEPPEELADVSNF
jgi:hypothetical protein